MIEDSPVLTEYEVRALKYLLTHPRKDVREVQMMVPRENLATYDMEDARYVPEQMINRVTVRVSDLITKLSLIERRCQEQRSQSMAEYDPQWGTRTSNYYALRMEQEAREYRNRLMNEYRDMQTMAMRSMYADTAIRPEEDERGNKSMSLSSLAKRLLDEDTKVLVKAGYLDSELELTGRGREALNALLFLANKEALVAEAKEKIAEDEKKNS